MSKLLNQLITDEKKFKKDLYSSGPYWNYKNSITIKEIKKKGLKDFRGYSTGIGYSFTDSLVLDIKNELNWKGRLVRGIFALPFLKKIFEGQLRITKNHLTDYLNNLSVVYANNENVLKLINKYKFNNTVDFGCLKKFKIKDKEYSTHYLDMADRIDKLSFKFDFSKLNSYFEIGGGFGAFTHLLITNFPNIKKIIYLDIVPNIYVGTEYLRSHFGESVKDYLNFKNQKEISFTNNNSLEIFCIPPWEIEKLNIKVDHFHNAASFVEMPHEVIKNYCKYIKKLNIRDISLISYEKYDPKTTFKPDKLNNYFDNSLNVFRHSKLIDDYKINEIYLTSK
tara:strand:- start:757 stop:1767 length:1011 start_codon:yes stop_codon:yes gene_type:complete